jgi:hypothetical protein
MTYNRADNLTKKGADANPNGRPKGAVTRTTCIRKALEAIALDDSEQSLEDFCKQIKKNEPVEFFKALVKLAPAKLDIESKGKMNLEVTFVTAESPKSDIVIDNIDSR